MEHQTLSSLTQEFSASEPSSTEPLLQLWKEIPNEILQLILQFDGRIKKRNGVYMNQILINDGRYKLLSSIPKKEFYGSNLQRQIFMINSEIVIETFVHFRNNRDENNQYFTIYFQEQIDSPYKITHSFSKNFFTKFYSFILP